MQLDAAVGLRVGASVAVAPALGFVAVAFAVVPLVVPLARFVVRIYASRSLKNVSGDSNFELSSCNVFEVVVA